MSLEEGDFHCFLLDFSDLGGHDLEIPIALASDVENGSSGWVLLHDWEAYTQVKIGWDM